MTEPKRLTRPLNPDFREDVTFNLPKFIVKDLHAHADELGEHPDLYVRRAVVLRGRMREGVYAPLGEAHKAKLIEIHERGGVSYETLMTRWLEAAIDAHHAALDAAAQPD